jgi:hypothetical protein
MQVLIRGRGRRWFRDEYIAEPGQYWIQQFIFVFDYNEKSCIVTEQFNASSQGGLGVDGQMMCVEKHNDFEFD